MIVVHRETLWSPAPQPMDDDDDDELNICKFCALSQNNQHLLEKTIVQETKKWHWNISRPSGF